MLIVSPTEPKKLRDAAGKVSMVPEHFGADIAFYTKGGWVGIQRKELKDLISSVHDGRLGEQLGKMAGLRIAVLLVEGKVQWTLDGELMAGNWQGKRQGREVDGFTKRQFRGALWSARARGVWVDFTESVDETLVYAEWLESWARKAKHTGLASRPGPVSTWGTPDNLDYARHLVMGVPGVGLELATRIVDRFGVPFAWKVSREELMTVEGVGKKKVDAMMRALGTSEGIDDV